MGREWDTEEISTGWEGATRGAGDLLVVEKDLARSLEEEDLLLSRYAGEGRNGEERDGAAA